MNETTESNDYSADRWTLMRDIGVLQVKLVVDGLRDLVLVPASLIAGLFSLFSNPGGRPGDQFYQLLGAGKQSEQWINLFGALKNARSGVEYSRPQGKVDMDDLVGRIEKFMIDEHKRGGLTAQAKERLDRALDAFQKRKRSSGA